MKNTCSVHAEWTNLRPGKDLYLAIRDGREKMPAFRFLGRGKGFAEVATKV